MANLEKIITLTASQYQTLLDNGTVGGYTGINPNYLYMVPEESTALSDISGASNLQAIEAISGTSGLLKKEGENSWSLDTNEYLTSSTLPLAANGTRGGAQIGYTTDATNHNYAVQLSSEKMYVNVPWTDNDTKVTSATNHYTPSTVSGQDKTASASGATAAWGIDVVQGITVNTDGKGHITGLNVTSGKIPSNPNTDTKLTVAEVTSGTTYYPIVGTGTTAATRQYDTTGFVYKGTNGTTSTVGSAQLTLGNSTASGTANNKQGKLILYGSTAYTHTISGAPTAARTLTLPNKSGTIAVTDDIPDISITPGNGLINGTSGSSQTAITGSGTISIGEGKVTNTMLANSKITIAGNEVSLGGSISLADLGLSQALRFIGITSTALSDGATTSTLTAKTTGSLLKTTGFVTGDVVIDTNSTYEYVWTGNSWERLGGDSSYKTTQTAVSDPTESSATSTTFIDTISQDENGVITATKKTLPTYPTSFTITASATDGLWNLTGTSGSNQVTYAVGAYSSKQSTAAFYTAATDPTLTTRLNYDGYLYATKLYSSGNEVLTTHQTIKQDGITGATITRFGTCDTTAGTATKTISISSGTFTLEAGARVTVNFTYANTASNPKLNVNSKGAKNIFHRGAQITTDVNKALLAGVCDFVYDGAQWHLIGNYYDTDTTYSSESAASGGTTLSLVTTGEKYTWNNKANTATTLSGYGITDAKIASGVITLGSNTITPLTASSTLDATKLSGTIPSECYTNSRDAGYGKITPANNTSTTSALTGNTTAVVASNYNENLKLTAANKWVVLAGTNSDTAGSDELKIAHLVPSSISNTGPTANQTGSRGSTFNIPKITLDEAGHVTGISSITVSLPSSDNTDEKVKQNSSTTSAAYKLLMTTAASPTSGNAYETNYATTLSYNPSTKVLTNGTITLTTASSTTANTAAYDVLNLGNSTNVTSTTAHSEGKINIYSAATKSHIIIGKSTTTDYTHTLPNQTGLLVTLNSAAPSADIGSTTKPVYVSSAGVVTEANTYAGGTAVTLNGTSAAGSTASFYAPTTAGTSGYYLKSNGSGAPTWTSFPTIPSITLNGSSTTSPSFYAPTSAGTSGQYLKSNGSGAPTWANMPAAVTATASGSGNVVTGMSVTNNAITYTLGTVSTVSAQIVRW